MTFNNPYICCILMYIHAFTWLWIQQGTIKRSVFQTVLTKTKTYIRIAMEKLSALVVVLAVAASVQCLVGGLRSLHN